MTEPTNWCVTCRKAYKCVLKGVFQQQVCSEYERASVFELLDPEEITDAIMVGSCPRCGGSNTHDCEDEGLLGDITIGHCLDCEAFWCLECGYMFVNVRDGTRCPHWEICARCSDDHGYLNEGEFVQVVCPLCEHYDEGCQLEDPSECAKSPGCPYEGDITRCPEIIELLEEHP